MNPQPRPRRRSTRKRRNERTVPRWDKQAHQLWWQNVLVKEYHGPAPNQKLVLEAFEEQDWPARIDDPLPKSSGVESKVRLHDTIKALNSHHKHRVLRFGGDGSGLGIRWFLMKKRKKASPRPPPALP